MNLQSVETLVNKARNHYRLNKDASHPLIEGAEAAIARASPRVLAEALDAGFLVHPAGTAHFYILLVPRK